MSVRSRRLSIGLFWLSGLVFLIYAVLRSMEVRLTNDIAGIILPVFIYGIAHMLRAVRLGVLLQARQVRRLLGLYFYTTACSAVIPFKLGELVRINEIASWTNSYWRGLLVVWIERVFDVVALGAVALFILSSGVQDPKDIGLLLWAISAFVFITLLFFFIVPEQLCSLNLHVIRSYKGRKAVNILRMLDSFHQLFEQVRPLLAGKLVTLSVLTIFIWGAELFSIAILFESLLWGNAASSLVHQFSVILGYGSRGESVATFEGFKVLLLISCGIVALLFYGRLRIHQSKGSKEQ